MQKKAIANERWMPPDQLTLEMANRPCNLKYKK